MSYLRRHAAFVVFAAIMLAAPAVTSNHYYLSILAFMATRLMIALGLVLLMGQAGQISLGHAAFAGIGAYGSAIFTTRWELDPWLAMVLAAILAGVLAGVVGVPTLKLKGHYLAMGTLGVGEIVYILMVQLKGLTNGSDGITGIPPLSLGPLDLSQPKAFHIVAWIVALVMLRLSLNLSRSRTGRALTALHRAEVAASSLGVDTAFHKVQIFVVSAVFASIAGSFYAHYVLFVSPESWTITFSVILVTGAVIGGLGNIWGAVWGTFVMMLLPELLKNMPGLGENAQDYTELAFGLLLMIIMIFLPGGLVSLPRALTGARRRLGRRAIDPGETDWTEGQPARASDVAEDGRGGGA